jgi:adenylate cyclase
MGTDTDATVIVPGIAGDSHSARGMRLRLQFDDRELLVDQRHSSITIGRAENNDVVVKGHLISRLHARIEISRNKFIILVDQSTNGSFVQTADGDELFVLRDSLQLKGQGMIGLGRVPEQDSSHTIRFTCEEV